MERNKLIQAARAAQEQQKLIAAAKAAQEQQKKLLASRNLKISGYGSSCVKTTCLQC